MLEICKVLKRKFHINYLNVLKTNTLAKEPALEQKKLNLKERISNAEKKFRINENVLNKIPKNSVLVIIDDIFTTGSTIYACSKLLSSNGFNVSQIMAVTAFQEL